MTNEMQYETILVYCKFDQHEIINSLKILQTIFIKICLQQLLITWMIQHGMARDQAIDPLKHFH